MAQRKYSTHAKEASITRRDVFSALTGAIGATVATDAGTYHLHTAHQTLSETLFFTDKDRLALVGRIFFSGDTDLDVIPARNHPTLKLASDELTYSNELRALRAIRSLFGPAKNIVQELYAPTNSHSLVSIGASVSNKLTRSVLGPPKAPTLRFNTSQFSATLPYTIREVQGPHVSRLQDGKELTVPNLAIVDASGRPVAIPESRNQALKSDVLLVTRMPRAVGGPELTIFSGLHGPGVQAVEHLLFHAPGGDLLYLRQMLEDQGESPYFQAIFRVDNLYEQDNTTKPGTLTLLRSAASKPRPIEIRLK
jgi:hypothetical protein